MKISLNLLKKIYHKWTFQRHYQDKHKHLLSKKDFTKSISLYLIKLDLKNLASEDKDHNQFTRFGLQIYPILTILDLKVKKSNT